MTSAALQQAIKLARMTPRMPVQLPQIGSVAAASRKVEIQDHEPTETSIEVTACNGQIVIVTSKEAVEATAAFHRLDALPGQKIRVDQIQRAVCEQYGVSRDDIVSARRTANIVRPRQVAMYLAKTLTLRSLPDIGRRFGGRDHTTVLHAVRKITAATERDPELSEIIRGIKARIGVEENHA
jgi:chromosomal replication initiation ATPase DnaA